MSKVDINVTELAKFEIKDALQRRYDGVTKVSITVPSGVVPDWDFSYLVVCDRSNPVFNRSTDVFYVQVQGPWFKPLGLLKCAASPAIMTYAVAEWVGEEEPTWFTSPDIDLVPWLDECLPSAEHRVPLTQDELDFVSVYGFAQMLVSMPREE